MFGLSLRHATLLTFGISSACAIAACSGSGSGTPNTGTGGSAGTSGNSGSGGTGATGATGANGGTGATGGGTSPGKAQVIFEIDNGKSYCATSSCGSTPVPSVKDQAGKSYKLSVGDCYTPCDTCEMLPCPGVACEIDHGVEVTGSQVTWDGGYFVADTCNGSSGSVSCYTRVYAPAGNYVASWCATPGTLVDDPQYQVKQCQTSGPAECVDAPFVLPSSSPVTVKLP
ncbi:MAG: hypothetical protein R3B13_24975 [Polyangiaceae bacterium]